MSSGFTRVGEYLRKLLRGYGLVALATLSACATHFASPDQEADHYLSAAQFNILTGNCAALVGNVQKITGNPVGLQRARQFLADSETARQCHYSQLETAVGQAMSPSAAMILADRLDTALSAGGITPAQHAEIRTALRQHVLEGNRSGSLPFYLSDHADRIFPDLASAEHQKLILDRSIAIMQTRQGTPRSIHELMDYVRQQGVASREGRRIEKLLPSLYVRAREIPDIATVFPKFSEVRKQEITLRLHMQFKNTEQAVSRSLAEKLQANLRGIDWMPTAGPGITVLTIEQVAQAERELPERIDTVTHSYLEPETVYYKGKNDKDVQAHTEYRTRYSSYNRYTSSREIEYGFTLRLTNNAVEPYENTVRGLVSSNSVRCEGWTFVPPAGCAPHIARPFDQLRDEELDRVVNEISDIPAIAEIQEMN